MTETVVYATGQRSVISGRVTDRYRICGTDSLIPWSIGSPVVIIVKELIELSITSDEAESISHLSDSGRTDISTQYL